MSNLPATEAPRWPLRIPRGKGGHVRLLRAGHERWNVEERLFHGMATAWALPDLPARSGAQQRSLLLNSLRDYLMAASLMPNSGLVCASSWNRPLPHPSKHDKHLICKIPLWTLNVMIQLSASSPGLSGLGNFSQHHVSKYFCLSPYSAF